MINKFLLNYKNIFLIFLLYLSLVVGFYFGEILIMDQQKTGLWNKLSSNAIFFYRYKKNI